jgi:hypothetical protein
MESVGLKSESSRRTRVLTKQKRVLYGERPPRITSISLKVAEA